jgi:hypothetical protein
MHETYRMLGESTKPISSARLRAVRSERFYRLARH